MPRSSRPDVDPSPFATGAAGAAAGAAGLAGGAAAGFGDSVDEFTGGASEAAGDAMGSIADAVPNPADALGGLTDGLPEPSLEGLSEAVDGMPGADVVDGGVGDVGERLDDALSGERLDIPPMPDVPPPPSFDPSPFTPTDSPFGDGDDHQRDLPPPPFSS